MFFHICLEFLHRHKYLTWLGALFRSYNPCIAQLVHNTGCAVESNLYILCSIPMEAFVSDDEVSNIVDFLADKNPRTDYDNKIEQQMNNAVLTAGRLLVALRIKQHISFTKKLLCAVHIQNGSGVHTGSDSKGNT